MIQNGTKFSKLYPFNLFSCFKQHPILNLVNYVNFIPFGCAGSTLWRLAGKKHTAGKK